MSIYNTTINNYINNYRALLNYGLYVGLIKPFDEELFKKIRYLFQDNIPAVLLVLDNNLVQKHCYDRAKLLTYAFDDEFEIITANIDALKYNPKYIEKHLNGKLNDKYCEHCYVKRHFDGRNWIYDTSLGLMIEENLYNEMQHPQITSKTNKKPTLEEIKIKSYNDTDLINNKDEIKTVIDTFKDSLFPTNESYKDIILNELNEILLIINKEEKKEMEK